MAGVTWQLGQTAVVDLFSAIVVLVALALLFTTKLNPAWFVLGGGAIGLASQFLVH
jgi:chromate transporter